MFEGIMNFFKKTNKKEENPTIIGKNTRESMEIYK